MATICVYGAARQDIDPEYIRETERLGNLIAEHGHRIIYGAGSTGLMGAVARGVNSAGGYVVGVTPHFMHKFEPIFECNEIIETKTMAERKGVMENGADAFIVTPGGIGTFDEFFQILTLKELEQLNNKPIVLFNINGYYDELCDMMKSANEKGFLREGVLNMFTVCSTPEEAISEIDRELSEI